MAMAVVERQIKMAEAIRLITLLGQAMISYFSFSFSRRLVYIFLWVSFRALVKKNTLSIKC